MHKLSIVSALVCSSMLGACAGQETMALSAAAPVPGQTGTLLSNTTSGRTVKVIGNQSVREEINPRSLGNEIGARGN